MQTMRTAVRPAILATAALCAGSVLADTIADCGQVRNAELRLQACSEIIAGEKFGAEDKATAYRNRGNMRADAGAGAQALADFNEAVRLRPDDAGGYSGRARAKLATGDVDGAIGDYGDALRLAPGTAAHLVGRGHAHFVKGNTAAAIADFSEALKVNPKSASTLNRRGLAFRRSGDLARAIDDYTAAIALNPVYALAYNNRGYVYEAQGRKQDAIADFRSAVLLDPSLVGARDGLRRLGIADALVEETSKQVRKGKALVELNCSGCHATGPSGASPNKTAPEFRGLHKRYAGLALREPLSRGIAAPHDQMPNFLLAGPEVDAIVAYINSLSEPKAAAPKGRQKAKTGVAAADGDPVDLGDHRKGYAYARRNCSACHNVSPTGAPSPASEAPPFKTIANTPGMSVTALTVWSRTVHPSMPNLVIEPDDLDDLIAYMLSLRGRK